MTKIITATIVAAALVTFALSGEASAKPGNGNHHHHWYGGSVFVLGENYEPDCYMVKKYSPSGRPYLVEVCG